MKISYFVGQSIDGYMADVNGGVSWMEKPMNTKEMVNKNTKLYEDFLSTIDIIIMGSTTYEQLVNEIFTDFWPYPDHISYIATTTKNHTDSEKIKFINDVDLFLKNNNDKNIWLVGGATLGNYFMKRNLVDEFIITTVPVCLGDGVKLFDHVKLDNLKIGDVLHNGDYITTTYVKS